MKVIEMPAPEKVYTRKVYSIEIEGQRVKKVVGIEKALKAFKYYKYSNFSSIVSFSNLQTKEVLKVM
jgi:hypothetical protein